MFPKVQKPASPPPVPTRADASVYYAGQRQIEQSSLLSGTNLATTLARKPNTVKPSLLGG